MKQWKDKKMYVFKGEGRGKEEKGKARGGKGLSEIWTYARGGIRMLVMAHNEAA